MRQLALGVFFAIMATTVFTTTDAEAGRLRRCRQHYNPCVQTAPCGNWNYGNACGTANCAPMNYGQVNYAPVNYAPVHAACAPAQPVTYTAGYAPMNNQVAPPPPQNNGQPVNDQLDAPPMPQPVE